MANEQKEFWSPVAQKYDRVVDLQIGETTRSMVWDRVMKEGRLGELACIVSVMFRGCSQGHCDGATAAKRSGHDGPDWDGCKMFSN